MAVAVPAEAGISEASTERHKLLLSRIVEGDRKAFAELFDCLAPCILGFLIRLVRQRDLAEEILQEAFLQAWTQADSYRPESGSPRSWLLVIARSRGLDRLRRDISRRRREKVFCQDDREAAAPLGTSRLENQDRRDAVRAALGRLPDGQKVCLELAFGGDLSQTEIAERLAMPLGSVKSRVRLGMRKLGGVLASKR